MSFTILCGEVEKMKIRVKVMKSILNNENLLSKIKELKLIRLDQSLELSRLSQVV